MNGEWWRIIDAVADHYRLASLILNRLNRVGLVGKNSGVDVLVVKSDEISDENDIDWFLDDTK
ncbi:hypothetical protein [Haladaptatus sp. DFWS20]|uniref:hypothetical protein n=1 Tax=Haladaptatus sp. DFWS20 TaxID=3403467 RepID=UPI003EB82C15